MIEGELKEKAMIYKITAVKGSNVNSLGFNKYSNMIAALETILETIDGFEEGKTKIIVTKEEETEER